MDWNRLCIVAGLLLGLVTWSWAQGVVNPQTNAAALTTGTLASARLSGSYTGITGTGTLTAGATGAGFTVALTTSTVTGNLPAANLPSTAIVNSLGADVLLSNTGTYFDGPSVAQGVTGTWFASGAVTLADTAVAAAMSCKLWDGTTVIASGQMTTAALQFRGVVALSGYLASPAGNIRISCKDGTATTGKIEFNNSGNSKDSTISAYRIL